MIVAKKEITITSVSRERAKYKLLYTRAREQNARLIEQLKTAARRRALLERIIDRQDKALKEAGL